MVAAHRAVTEPKSPRDYTILKHQTLRRRSVSVCTLIPCNVSFVSLVLSVSPSCPCCRCLCLSAEAIYCLISDTVTINLYRLNGQRLSTYIAHKCNAINTAYSRQPRRSSDTLLYPSKPYSPLFTISFKHHRHNDAVAVI